jgi:acylphosphatase
VQLKLFHIDGTRASLSEHRGFRKFVQVECQKLELKGYVWRVPNVHGKILAIGTRSQLDSLLRFVHDLQQYHFIQTFKPENPEFAVLTESFDILPSNRRHVETGLYSDQDLDDVVSTASADLPMLRGSPSPHSHD